MKLPNGITGFSKGYLETDDRQCFKRLCYDIVSRTGGEVLDWKEASYPRNYSRILVLFGDEHFFIFANAIHPYIGFAAVAEDSIITYMDMPLLQAEFAAHSYTVLTKEELESPFLLNEHNLGEEEIRQVRFWRPATLGEVIFNERD